MVKMNKCLKIKGVKCELSSLRKCIYISHFLVSLKIKGDMFKEKRRTLLMINIVSEWENFQ